RLEKRFGRMGADVKPVADDEIYEVVRRRLFESLGEPRDHITVADAYLKMYQEHSSELPSEATRGSYRERILNAYPFHPTLIDALYLRWGSHSDFQRTRGVLRLLASIVGDLWQRRHTETQSQPLIQPCHINWRLDPLHAALTRLWGVAYESVAAADVVGERANAVQLDEERGGDYLRERIAQGLAAAILLGSFGGQGERAGFSARELKLCVARPEVNWAYIDGALLELETRGFYLRAADAGAAGKRYWFGSKPTLTKLIVQYRAQFAARPVDDAVIRTLQDQVANLRTEPAPWRVIVNPSTDLPEQKALTLLVMPPDCAYAPNDLAPSALQRVLQLSERCGNRDRLYRNTLLFLLPSARGLERLRSALREVAALEAVGRDYADQLDTEQREDLMRRLEEARKTVGQALGVAYAHVARVEGHAVAVADVAEVKPSFAEHLQAVWRQVVEEEEWVLRRVGPVTLQKVGLVPTEGGIRVKDAVEAFLRYTDKPMIASPSAVLEGLKQACQEHLIGLARGIALNNLQKKWCGAAATLDASEEGLWIIPPFEEEKPSPLQPSPPSPEQPGTGTKGETTRTAGGQVAPPPPPSQKVQRIRIRGIVPLESWTEVFRCFVAPAAQLGLKRLHLGIAFELQAYDEQPLDENDPRVAAMREAARQLGLEWEEEKPA
ncbi:MAG: DUF499 domain-containing protein, partial [Anaerolineae bacterium]|nr:DUF499 domain-containing protein [Anaerolineae bacterium]